LTISLGCAETPIILMSTFPALQLLSLNGKIEVIDTPDKFPALTCLDYQKSGYYSYPWPTYITNTKSIRYLRLLSPEHVRALSQIDPDHRTPEGTLESKLLISQLEKCPNIQRIVFVISEIPLDPVYLTYFDPHEGEIEPDILMDTWQYMFESFARQDRVVFCTASYKLLRPQLTEKRNQQLGIYIEWLECNRNGYPSWVNWSDPQFDIEGLSHAVRRTDFMSDDFWRIGW
jgi:hypothetical protein